MWFSIVAFFIEHQAVIFGIFSGIIALILVFLVPASLQVRGGDRGGWEERGVGAAIWGWVKWVGLVVIVFAAGYSCGSRAPVSATGHLEFPKLVCDHRGSTLMLFLHGWKGDAKDTWTLYPHLVCGDRDFADADVLSLDYPIYILQGNLTMEQLGSWIADRLAANGVARYRRVVIIAHSIGGLVARRLVLEQRPELRNIIFLLEIATPHTGPANYAQLLQLMGFKGKKLVGELKEESEFLRKLKTDWQALPSKPRTYCIGSPQDWLVSIASAHDSCTEPHVMPSYDHRGLVKPENIYEDRYRVPMYAVRGFLQADAESAQKAQ
jgi:pimeloyl-ACP methyl ester carboxylesterase